MLGRITASPQKWLILIVISAILGVFWINQSRFDVGDVSAENQTAAPIVSYQSPPYELTTINGEPFNSNDLIGQPVLLNFWATWCGPCRAEMPALQSIAEQFDGRAHVIGINQGESLAAIEPFAAEFGITYPLLLDQNRAINRRYTIRALPTTYFIDANGIIREVLHGTASEAVLATKLEAVFEP